MRRKKALAVFAALAMPLAVPMAATADDEESQTFRATLAPLNDSGASGSITVTLEGDQATVTETVAGLATTFNGQPYPHVQHIHINAQGKCPTPAADTNGDGVVDTLEGKPAYGAIGTSLTTSGDTGAASGTDLKRAPSGGSFTYERTFTLNEKTLKSVRSGTGVVVVHGLDPSMLSKQAQQAKSNLVPSLPLAATSPALCGPLMKASEGGVAAGGGSTSGIEQPWLFGIGAAALLAAGGTVALRRRVTGQQ